MLILAIETSCDETSIAFLESSFGGELNSDNFLEYINSFDILAHTISTQIATHAEFGGVIPEIGARLHAEQIHYLFERTVLEALGGSKQLAQNHPDSFAVTPPRGVLNAKSHNLNFNDPKTREFLSNIDYICVTTEPGLKSALRVGEEFAKTLQFYIDLKLGKKAEIVKVNHLKGHVFSSFYEVKETPVSYAASPLIRGNSSVDFALENGEINKSNELQTNLLSLASARQVHEDGRLMGVLENTPFEGVKPKVSGSLEVTIENEGILKRVQDDGVFLNSNNGILASNNVFPHLHLLVSGGNSQLILLRNPFEFQIVGQTLDDAAGECFDKTARMFGLSYPGGVSLARIAGLNDTNYLDFPVSMKRSPELNFSFSGLKTAVRYFVQKNELLNYEEKLTEVELHELLNYDLKTLTTPKPSVSPLQKGYLQPNQKLILIKKLSISIQSVIVEQLIDKLKKAIKEFGPKSVGLSGGVSANRLLRQKIQEVSGNKSVFIPDLSLTGDNAVMIGLAGAVLLKNKDSNTN